MLILKLYFINEIIDANHLKINLIIISAIENDKISYDLFFIIMYKSLVQIKVIWSIAFKLFLTYFFKTNSMVKMYVFFMHMKNQISYNLFYKAETFIEKCLAWMQLS